MSAPAADGRVLVTGATGLHGGAAAQALLAAGHQRGLGLVPVLTAYSRCGTVDSVTRGSKRRSHLR